MSLADVPHPVGAKMMLPAVLQPPGELQEQESPAAASSALQHAQRALQHAQQPRGDAHPDSGSPSAEAAADAAVEAATQAAAAAATAGPAAADPAPSGHQDVVAKILISNAAAGSIIGKAGQTIETIQTSSGARVQLSRAGEFYPGTSDRVLLLSGPLHCVLTAIFLMLEKLPRERERDGAALGSPHSAGSDGPWEDVVRLVVSRKLCGAVIGTKGQTVKEFKADSGAEIRVQPLIELSPSDCERLISVSGPRDRVLRAVALVLNTLSADDKFLAYMDLTLQLAATQGLIPASRAAAVKNSLASARAVLTVALADEDVGAILGKKGQTLSHIQQSAKVAIKISDRSRMDPVSHEREVTLSGTYGGIQLAAAMVAERIAAARPAARLSSDGGGLRGAGRLGSFEEEDVGAYDD